MTDFSVLLPHCWKTQVLEWLKEDTPSFDYGGFVVGSKMETGHLLGKSPGVVAGVPFFDAIFEEVGCTVEWHVKEGSSFDAITKIATVKGPANMILQGERPALNLFARASGIATMARRLALLKEKEAWHGFIAGTRKTTPGFRIVEKYAMLVGGVDTHRYDLSSMVMLKDNHIISTGSITAAVTKARSVCGFSVKIEVECQNQEEAEEGIIAGADVVMLDNLSPEEAKEAACNLKKKFPHSSALIEASGGITEHTVASYFSKDIDVLSLGSLSQGVPHVDYSLKLVHS